MRAARFLVPMTALALLAGCAGGGSDGDAGRDHDDGTSASSADDAEAGSREGDTGITLDDGSRLVVTEQTEGDRARERSALADDEADGSDVADATAATAELAACLQGTWRFTHASLEERMVADAGVWSDITATVTGNMTMTFDPLTVTTRYEGFRTNATSGNDTKVIETTSAYDGSTVATYSLDRDLMSVDATDISGLTSETATTINGVEVTNPELEARQAAADRDTVAPPRTEQVTCSRDRLTLVPLAGNGVPMPDLMMTAKRS